MVAYHCRNEGAWIWGLVENKVRNIMLICVEPEGMLYTIVTIQEAEYGFSKIGA